MSWVVAAARLREAHPELTVAEAIRLTKPTKKRSSWLGHLAELLMEGCLAVWVVSREHSRRHGSRH